jgi:N-acetylmuramoyl-L-alanine amidase
MEFKYIESKFKRPRTKPIEMIVIHHTGTNDMDSTIMWFKPDPPRTTQKVSAHYIIGRNGKIVQMVYDFEVAYHAGVACWRIDGIVRRDINGISIGIELCGNGNTDPYTDAQYNNLINLVSQLRSIYHIPMINIVGHSHISPGRKVDPGIHFDWVRFKKGVDVP